MQTLRILWGASRTAPFEFQISSLLPFLFCSFIGEIFIKKTVQWITCDSYLCFSSFIKDLTKDHPEPPVRWCKCRCKNQTHFCLLSFIKGVPVNAIFGTSQCLLLLQVFHTEFYVLHLPERWSVGFIHRQLKVICTFLKLNHSNDHTDASFVEFPLIFNWVCMMDSFILILEKVAEIDCPTEFVCQENKFVVSQSHPFSFWWWENHCQRLAWSLCVPTHHFYFFVKFLLDAFNRFMHCTELLIPCNLLNILPSTGSKTVKFWMRPESWSWEHPRNQNVLWRWFCSKLINSQRIGVFPLKEVFIGMIVPTLLCLVSGNHQLVEMKKSLCTFIILWFLRFAYRINWFIPSSIGLVM